MVDISFINEATKQQRLLICLLYINNPDAW